MLNDLIRAGVTQAETLVIVDKESSKWAEESYMADSGSVVNVYFLSRSVVSLSSVCRSIRQNGLRAEHISVQNASKSKALKQN